MQLKPWSHSTESWCWFKWSIDAWDFSKKSLYSSILFFTLRNINTGTAIPYIQNYHQRPAFDGNISLSLLRIIQPFSFPLYSSFYVFVCLSLREKYLCCVRFVFISSYYMGFFLPQNCLVQSWQENGFHPSSPIQSKAQTVCLSLASDE